MQREDFDRICAKRKKNFDRIYAKRNIFSKRKDFDRICAKRKDSDISNAIKLLPRTCLSIHRKKCFLGHVQTGKTDFFNTFK